jgi:hypothetical protein
MRIIFSENGWLFMVLEVKCFQGVGAFEVYLLKVSALKLPHRLPVPFLRTSASFPNYDTVSRGGGI